jgi:hypothetical protein
VTGDVGVTGNPGEDAGDFALAVFSSSLLRDASSVFSSSLLRDALTSEAKTK